MATVVSLTETKIQELLTPLVELGVSQDEINALISQLNLLVGAQGVSLEEFNEVILPQLNADVAGASNAVSDLTTNVIPDLDQKLIDREVTLETLVTYTIPTLQSELDANTTVIVESPKVYVQPEAPENPDENERYLVVGDTWHDDDDDNKPRIWNGVEWSTFSVDVAGLAETIAAQLSPDHAIFASPVAGSLPVTNGANITPTP